ncbi:LysR family transcriptional regulator, partial [Bacillus cereus]
KELHLENTISPIYTQIAWHKDKWMTVPLRQFIDVTREFFVTD